MGGIIRIDDVSGVTQVVDFIQQDMKFQNKLDKYADDISHKTVVLTQKEVALQNLAAKAVTNKRIQWESYEKLLERWGGKDKLNSLYIASEFAKKTDADIKRCNTQEEIDIVMKYWELKAEIVMQSFEQLREVVETMMKSAGRAKAKKEADAKKEKVSA
jgi:hypothetical protein